MKSLSKILRAFILLSYIEGLFYAIMVASSESFALYLAVGHGMSPRELGLVSTVPLLLGALAQWVFPRFVSEKRLVFGVLLSLFTQILGIAGLYYSSVNSYNFIYFFISLSLYWIGGLSAAPLWLDWMSGHIPGTAFNSFLSRRNGIVMFCVFIFFLLFGYYFEKIPQNQQFYFFVIGLIGRVLSFITLALVAVFIRGHAATFEKVRHIHSIEGEEELTPSLFKLLIITFIWTGLFRMAVSMSGPYFLPFMLNELKFNMHDYVLIVSIPLLSRSLFFESWGFASKGLRSFMGLGISCIWISSIPTLWTLSTSIPYLIAVEVGSGIAWAGFELSTILIVQSVVGKGARKFFGLHMAIMNLFSVIGSLIGAEILKNNFSLEFLFNLSSAMRLFFSLILIYHMSKWGEARFDLNTYGRYMFTVLSPRHSIHAGRLLFARFRTEFSSRGKKK